MRRMRAGRAAPHPRATLKPNPYEINDHSPGQRRGRLDIPLATQAVEHTSRQSRAGSAVWPQPSSHGGALAFVPVSSEPARVTPLDLADAAVIVRPRLIPART